MAVLDRFLKNLFFIHLTSPKYVLTVAGNTTDIALLVTDKCKEDSDTEPCGGDSSSRNFEVVSRRNLAALAKCGAQLKTSSATPLPGNGLFADANGMKMGARVPAKGPWFDSLADASAWIC